VNRMSLVATLAAVALACCCGRLQAQAQMPTSTRVAIVNVGLVLSKYEKAMAFKAEMETLLKPFREQDKKYRDAIKAFQDALQKPDLKAEDKLKYQQAIVDYKRVLEDLERATEAKVGTRQRDQIVTLFQDVSNAVKAYAQANGIHLVLAYGDQVEGDRFSFQNINRIMTGMDLGSTNPFFFVPGVDISSAIADALNQGHRAVSGTPASLPKK
jgi:Skp family chaperone for outer membrane proteins